MEDRRGGTGEKAGVEVWEEGGLWVLAVFSIEVRGGGVEAGSSLKKSLKQAFAAALPGCWTLIGCGC